MGGFNAGGMALGYYTHSPGDARRPTGATVIAIFGIILASLSLLANGMEPWEELARGLRQKYGSAQVDARDYRYGYPYETPRGVSAAEIALLTGVMAHVTFGVMMLIGSCGVLCNRSTGRRMMLVSSWAWIVAGSASLVLMLYTTLSGGAPSGSSAQLVVAITVVLVMCIYIVFPICALRVLNRPQAKRALGAGPWPRPAVDVLAEPPGGARKLTAIVLLAAAGLNALAAVATLLTPREQYRSTLLGYSVTYRLPILEGDRFSESAGAVLSAGVMTLAIIGAILVLVGRRSGTVLLVIFAIAQMALTVCHWGSGFGRSGNRSGAEITHAIAPWLNFIAQRFWSLLVPGLVLIVVTYRRPVALGATIAPPPPPPPFPPPHTGGDPGDAGAREGVPMPPGL